MKKLLTVILSVMISLSSSICVMAEGSYKLGDVNQDGQVSVIDAVLIQCYILENYDIDDSFTIIADVDGDKNVNIIDVVYVLRYIINIIDHFPAEDLTPTNPIIAEDGYYNKIVRP